MVSTDGVFALPFSCMLAFSRRRFRRSRSRSASACRLAINSAARCSAISCAAPGKEEKIPANGADGLARLFFDETAARFSNVSLSSSTSTAASGLDGRVLFVDASFGCLTDFCFPAVALPDWNKVLKVWSYTIMPHFGESALILQCVA